MMIRAAKVIRLLTIKIHAAAGAGCGEKKPGLILFAPDDAKSIKYHGRCSACPASGFIVQPFFPHGLRVHQFMVVRLTLRPVDKNLLVVGRI